MTDEAKRELETERKAQYYKEDREELLDDDRDMPDICTDCGEVLDGEYFEYEYNTLKGETKREKYCQDCFEKVLDDLKTQARRNTEDL